MKDDLWAALPLEDWQDTYATLHMWTQIVGKIRLAQTPLINHWWNVPLYVTARGLTTSAMPYEERTFEIEFDFIDHQLMVELDDGTTASIPLIPRSVADFYREVMHTLDGLGLKVERSKSDGLIHAPAFYSYTAPEPPGLKEAPVRPKQAFYGTVVNEFILLYDDVRSAAAPEDALLEFMQSTYEAGANLAKWDRAALER